MKILKKISIQNKLVLIQLLTTFAVLSFYSVFHIVRDTRFNLNAVNREVISMTELLGSNCVSALHFMDKETAGNILSTLTVEEQVVNAWIHDPDGGLFAEYDKTGYGDFHLEKPSSQTLTMQNNFVIASNPIVDDDETIGFISIRYDMESYNQLISKNKVISLIIFMIGMGTALLLAIVTQRTISKPILKLLQTMKQISRTGDYSIRPSKERDDEIGALSDGFGEMLNQIQVREAERNRVNAALQESEEKYRDLVERANDGIIILQDGIFKYVNPSLVAMAGCAEEDLLGSPFSEFIHDEEIAKVMDHYRGRMTGETVPAMYETRFKTSRGELIDAEVNAGFITYRGKPADLVFIRNITERKQIEQELKKHRERLEEMVADRTAKLEAANERLMELDHMKSMFMATMSHELRTPLNSIIGFTGLILQEIPGKLNEEQKKQLNMVKKSSQHLLALINDIIDINKIESGKADPKITAFDLIEVLRDVTRSFAVTVKDRGLTLLVDAPDQLPMQNDERRIKQVVINYLSNALKFTEKGNIRLSVEAVKDRAIIKISDTGIGIKKENIDKLFQSFSQIKESGKIQEGTGLGLYLSKKIADLIGGSVNVESVYGKGSTFIIEIPLIYRKDE